MSSVHSNNCYWLRWLLSLKHYWSDHSSSTSLISRQCGECEGVRLEPGPAWVLSNIFMLQLHFFRNYWSFWVTFRLSWAQFFPQHSVSGTATAQASRLPVRRGASSCLYQPCCTSAIPAQKTAVFSLDCVNHLSYFNSCDSWHPPPSKACLTCPRLPCRAFR